MPTWPCPISGDRRPGEGKPRMASPTRPSPERDKESPMPKNEILDLSRADVESVALPMAEINGLLERAFRE